MPRQVTAASKPEPRRDEPAEQKVDSVEVQAAKAKLASCLEAFDAEILKGDLQAACSVAERAKADPEMAAVGDTVAAFERIGQAYRKVETARKQALDALVDGKEHVFQTRKGSVKGVVLEVEGDTLKLTVEGRINKQVVKYGKSVALADLTPVCLAKVLGEQEPETPDEWMAEAILKMAAKDFEQAEKKLARAGAHVLVRHYRKWLDVLRLGKDEAAAKWDWEERMAPLIKVEHFSKADADAGLKLLRSFRSAHGKTTFAESVASRTAEVEVAMLAASGLRVVVASDPSLILHLKMDEATGSTAVDSSASKNDATLNNGVTRTAGRIGGGVTLQSGKGAMLVPAFSALELGKDGADFSVCLWMRLEEGASGKLRSIMRKGGHWTQHTPSLYVHESDNRLSFRVRTAGGPYMDPCDGSSELVLNEWTHVACVNSGSRLLLYLNGVLDGSLTLTKSIQSNNDALSIGPTGYGSQPKFSLDELRIYNRALSEAELSWLAGGIANPKASSSM